MRKQLTIIFTNIINTFVQNEKNERIEIYKLKIKK